MIYESFPHFSTCYILSMTHRLLGIEGHWCLFLLTLELQPLIEIPETSQCCCQSPQQPEGRRHGKRERETERDRDMETRSSIRDAECKKKN